MWLLIGLFLGYFFGLMQNTSRLQGLDQDMGALLQKAAREVSEGQTLYFHASVGKGRDDDGGEGVPILPVFQDWRNN